MSDSVWTITPPTGSVNPAPVLFADLGLDEPEWEEVSLKTAGITLSSPAQKLGDDPYWAEGSTVIVFRDGARWFYGRALEPVRSGSGNSEGLTYTLNDPGWYLDQTTFRQTWMIWNGALTELVPTYKSRVIYGQQISGDAYTKIASGLQIVEALTWAIGCGAPIQIGTIGPSMTTPYSEVNDKTCFEVIRDMLRYQPDAVHWWDHSTLPYPSFNVTQRAVAPVVTLDLSAGTTIVTQDIQKRSDLVPPSVSITFEATNTVDESTFTVDTVVTAPDGATGLEIGALVATVQLQGGMATYQKQKVVVQSIGKTDPLWWKAKLPWLQDPSISAVVITGATSTPVAVGGSTFTQELISGAVPSWMDTNTTVAGEMKITANVAYKQTIDGVDVPFGPIAITTSVMGTNLSTNEYAQLTAFQAAEPVPNTMSQEIYDALKIAPYQGATATEDVDVDDAVRIGKVLNLTGDRTEWATMRALIQGVKKILKTGRTETTFGPPEHLSPQDLMALLRVNRGRMPSMRLTERVTGESTNGARVDGAHQTAKQDSAHAPTFVCGKQTDATGNTIDVKTNKLSLLAAAGDGTTDGIILDITSDTQTLLKIAQSQSYWQTIVKDDDGGFWTYVSNGTGKQALLSAKTGEFTLWDQATGDAIRLSLTDLQALGIGAQTLQIREFPLCDGSKIAILASAPYGGS